MEEKIKILSLFFNRARYENSPEILFKLDRLHKKIYEQHRIKQGFEEAVILAHEAVIKKVLNYK